MAHNFLLRQELCYQVVVKWDVDFLVNSLVDISPVGNFLQPIGNATYNLDHFS